MASRYGYGSPNNATPPSQPQFEREVDKFGLSIANENQGTSLVEDTKNKVNEIAQGQNALIKRNLRDTSIYAKSAQIPEGMPNHMKAIVKATDFDPMNTGSVKELQMKLNQTGYADSTGQPLKVDGKFGPKTAIAKLGLELDAEDEMNVTPMEMEQRINEERVKEHMMRLNERLGRTPPSRGAGMAAPPQQGRGGFGFGSKGQLG